MDLLIITDELDYIKQCALNIQEILQKYSYPRYKTITRRSIYDQTNEKRNFMCSKLLFLLQDDSDMKRSHISNWTMSCPLIKADRDKYLTIFVQTSPTKKETVNEKVITGYNNILDWWPIVIFFLHEKSLTKYRLRKTVQCEITATSNESTVMTQNIYKLLQNLGLIIENEAAKSDLVLILCDTLNHELERNRKAFLRSLKSGRKHVYFVSCDTDAPSLDVLWASTRHFSCGDHLLFVLALIYDLKVLYAEIPIALRLAPGPKTPDGPLLLSREGLKLKLKWPKIKHTGDDEVLVIKKRENACSVWTTVVELPSESTEHEVADMNKNSVDFALTVQNIHGDSKLLHSNSSGVTKTLEWLLLIVAVVFNALNMAIIIAVAVVLFLWIPVAVSSKFRHKLADVLPSGFNIPFSFIWLTQAWAALLTDSVTDFKGVIYLTIPLFLIFWAIADAVVRIKTNMSYGILYVPKYLFIRLNR